MLKTKIVKYNRLRFYFFLGKIIVYLYNSKKYHCQKTQMHSHAHTHTHAHSITQYILQTLLPCKHFTSWTHFVAVVFNNVMCIATARIQHSYNSNNDRNGSSNMDDKNEAGGIGEDVAAVRIREKNNSYFRVSMWVYVCARVIVYIHTHWWFKWCRLWTCFFSFCFLVYYATDRPTDHQANLLNV